jgi:transcriptional regulator with XRE-family HTH domain
MTTLTYIEFEDLRGALKAASMTQMDLSYRTNIDQAQISRYCNGVTPSPRNAAKIAEALGMLTETRAVGTVQVEVVPYGGGFTGADARRPT